MNIIEQLMTASAQLKELFKDKGELKGIGDWDTFIGCLMLIDNSVVQFQQMTQEPQKEPAEETTAEE